MEVNATENKTTINENEIYAQSAVLMDADSGRILYGKNENEVLAMASTTKILTCIIALEMADLEEMVEVSAYAASMPKVKLYMKEGERYRLRDLLYSLMLESHNDSAVAIAEHIGKDLEGFSGIMNEKAKEIGFVDSCFLTPNGLDAVKGDKKHSTTAVELAKIMSYCIRKSPNANEFLEITQTTNYAFSNEAGTRSFSMTNHNAFLTMMEGAISGKTGFTNQAGYCYVGALERDGKCFVVALLACGWPNYRTYKWSDTKKLMNYGVDNYEYHGFVEQKLDESKLQPIPVQNGQTKKMGQTAFCGVRVIEKKTTDGVLLRIDESIKMVYDIKKNLEAPVKEGSKIGTIRYLVEDEVFREDIVILTDSILSIDFKWCFSQIMLKYII